MLFNSFEFLLFLPIVFFLYWFVFNKSLRWQNVILLAASYFFYGWWSYKLLLVLALSTLLDYLYGFSVASTNRKKARVFLWLSIINNLGILGVFKYYNFFATEFQRGLELLGFHSNPVLLNIALPIGISFYTFHGMSYVFDIFRGKLKPESSFIDYALFVSFFPLLVSGPIERANHLLPQIQNSRFFKYTQAVEGCRLILWGMFKKIVIADSLAVIVDPMFSNYESFTGVSLIIGAIAFAFQIYGDFSGYSDIAIGVAKLFGFEILSNFKFPYFSRDIAEFWRRWHISLTSWFRDYLYIPLGGSRNGKIQTIKNIFIIFMISSFWHGPEWNFIAWGFLHACGFLPLFLLNINRNNISSVVAKDRNYPSLKELLQMFTTFSFVTLSWILFRAENLSHAYGYLKHILKSFFEFPKQFLMLPFGDSAFIYILPLVFVDWWFRRDERRLRGIKNKIMRYALYIIISMIVLQYLDLFSGNESMEFIYFQF